MDTAKREVGKCGIFAQLLHDRLVGRRHRCDRRVGSRELGEYQLERPPDQGEARFRRRHRQSELRSTWRCASMISSRLSASVPSKSKMISFIRSATFPAMVYERGGTCVSRERLAASSGATSRALLG